jgi:hypothetical protein
VSFDKDQVANFVLAVGTFSILFALGYGIRENRAPESLVLSCLSGFVFIVVGLFVLAKYVED